MNSSIVIHDDYDHENQLVIVKRDLELINQRQVVLEQKIDRIINFLDNHQALMLQKNNDTLAEHKSLFVQILTDVIDKENSSKIVVDKINEFLTENRQIYVDLFDSVYKQTKKNTEQIKSIKPLLDNIERTQNGISALLKLTYTKPDIFPSGIF
jgi:hypothetical protein